MVNTKRESSIVVFLFIVMVIIGAVFYHNIENLSYLDSIYFTIITLTTIGYGDIAPITAVGKIFTMFFALAGVGIMLYAVGVIGKYFIKLESRRIKSLKDKYNKKKNKKTNA